MASETNDFRRSLHLSFLTSMKYSGVTDGKHYIERFERMISAAADSLPDTDKMDIFTCTLSEDRNKDDEPSPAEWYDGLPPSSRRDWASFKRAFIERYKKGTTAQPLDLKSAVERLSQIRMAPGDSLDAYLHDFTEAYEDLGGAAIIQLDLAVSMMLKGLSPEDKLGVAGRLGEIYENAETVEKAGEEIRRAIREAKKLSEDRLRYWG